MSPIYVRPVREQLEHDRLIRQLQTKYQKKFEVAINVGEEHVAPVRHEGKDYFPDLVLYEGKKLAGVVEVESAESTNNLEAMAQWVHFARARVPFYLYVPVQAYDTAKRLADANSARITEIWTYRPAMDTFDLVRMHWDAAAVSRSGPKATAVPPKPAEPPAQPAPAPAPKTASPVLPKAAVPAPKSVVPSPKAAVTAPKAAVPAAKAAAPSAKAPTPAARSKTKSKAKPAAAKPARAKKSAKPGKAAASVKKPAAKSRSKAARTPDRSRKAGTARKNKKR